MLTIDHIDLSYGAARALRDVSLEAPLGEVTAVLADLGVNIEDFTTTTENGAWSGERLFRLAARLNIPPGTTSDEVRSALEAISGEIMVDFSFSAAGG